MTNWKRLILLLQVIVACANIQMTSTTTTSAYYKYMLNVEKEGSYINQTLPPLAR